MALRATPEDERVWRLTTQMGRFTSPEVRLCSVTG